MLQNVGLCSFVNFSCCLPPVPSHQQVQSSSKRGAPSRMRTGTKRRRNMVFKYCDPLAVGGSQVVSTAALTVQIAKHMPSWSSRAAAQKKIQKGVNRWPRHVGAPANWRNDRVYKSQPMLWLNCRKKRNFSREITCNLPQSEVEYIYGNCGDVNIF